MLKKMNPAQCRGARALLDMTQPQLAALAELGLSTIVDFERERRTVSEEAVDKMQRALAAAAHEGTKNQKNNKERKTGQLTCGVRGTRQLSIVPGVSAVLRHATLFTL